MANKLDLLYYKIDLWFDRLIDICLFNNSTV